MCIFICNTQQGIYGHTGEFQFYSRAHSNILSPLQRPTTVETRERADVSHFVLHSTAPSMGIIGTSASEIFEGPARIVFSFGSLASGNLGRFLSLASTYLNHGMPYCLYLTFTHSCGSSHGVNTSESGVHERVRLRARGRPRHLISYG